MRNNVRRTSWFAIVLMFIACGSRDELASGLKSQQSIDLVVALKNAGVDAERSKQLSGRNETFSVFVDRGSRDRALQVIHDQQLLIDSASGPDAAEQDGAFTPVSRELANLRLDRALATEVERLLRGLPGIVDVRSNIRSFFVRSLSSSLLTASEEPKAVVVIRYLSRAGNQPFKDEDIKRLVAQVVPGIKQEAITVSALRVDLGGSADLFSGASSQQTTPALADLGFLPIQVPEENRNYAMFVLSMVGAGVLFIGAVLGAAIVWRQRWKKG